MTRRRSASQQQPSWLLNFKRLNIKIQMKFDRVWQTSNKIEEILRKKKYTNFL